MAALVPSMVFTSVVLIRGSRFWLTEVRMCGSHQAFALENGPGLRNPPTASEAPPSRVRVATASLGSRVYFDFGRPVAARYLRWRVIPACELDKSAQDLDPCQQQSRKNQA